MELSWCRSFIAVYELGGFSSAARALHRSQSRISSHIAGLEEHLGEVLFNRDVHPASLTQAGEAFLPHARGMVDEWGAGVAAIEAQRGDISGTVAIGSMPSASSQILAPFLAQFARRHPRATFEVHEGPNSWLDEALAYRTIEVAIRPLLQVRPQRATEHHVLMTDPIVVVLPVGHELAEYESISLSQLVGTPVITTGEPGLDAKIGAEFRPFLDEIDVDREHSLAVSQPTTVYAFVEAGLGLGLMGQLPAQMFSPPSVVFRPLDHPTASRDIAAYYASTRRLSPAAEVFLTELMEFTTKRFGHPSHTH